MALFSNMALKATQGDAPFKYLGVVNDGSEKQGYLEYSTNEVLSKNAKFAVEYAYGDLVHIRSCLTNKYWVRSSTNGHWIVAQGVGPVVDATSWTCTLFRMDIDDNKKAKFYHVQSGRTICIPNDNLTRQMSLSIHPGATTEAMSFAVDYDTLVILPKFVAFKGSNGLYYQNPSWCVDHWDSGFLVDDIGNPDIVCEIRYTSDGHIRVKAANNVFFWSYCTPPTFDNLVACVSKGLSINQKFAATRVDKNVVALRSLANQKICTRADFRPDSMIARLEPSSKGPEEKKVINRVYYKYQTIPIGKQQLVAKANGVVRDSYLEVIEPVFNRTVNVREFDLDNARIYNVELLYSHEHVWDNYSDEIQSGSANGIISTTKCRTHSNSITISGSVATAFQTGIPFIANGSIKVSVAGNYCHRWDQTESETQQVGHTFTVVVKPMKRTIARGVATKGTCDVPFAYVQKDYPTDGGPPRVTKLNDGVFTGANAYNFRDEVRYEDLPIQVPAK